MVYRIAFGGFRHAHIRDIYQRATERADIQIAGSCEEDAATRSVLESEGQVEITHQSFPQMLEDVECDAVAIGDCYGRRAGLILKALAAGRHVISDKPICVSLAELDEIEKAADEASLVVGCMLDMRDLPVFLGLRDVLQSGQIGQLQTANIAGQHPLMFGKRPSWYFEPGMHGGVFNDIAVHAIDFLPWASGQGVQSVVAARGWNATLPQHPEFQQCGQAILTLDQGAGVLCDVSYLTPDSFAYQFPHYWRCELWGADGVAIGSANSTEISLYRNGETSVRKSPLPSGQPGAYLDSFIRETRGERSGLHLESQDVRRAARVSLQLQEAADKGLHNLEVA